MSFKFDYKDETKTLIVTEDDKTKVFKIDDSKYSKVFRYMLQSVTDLGNEESGNILRWNAIYVPNAIETSFNGDLTGNLKFAIDPSTESDWTDYGSQTFVEYKTSHYVLGNTQLLPSGIGYEGEPMHTDWKFCLLILPNIAFPTDDPDITCIASPDITNQNWKVKYGNNLTFVAPAEINQGIFYDLANNIYTPFELYSNFTQDQFNILKSHNGDSIKITWDNDERVGTIDYQSEDESEWVEVHFDDETADAFLTSGDMHEFLTANVDLYRDPFPYEFNQEIHISMNLDDIIPANP